MAEGQGEEGAGEGKNGVIFQQVLEVGVMEQI